MSEEIKKWNPEDAINAIKERIRSEFVQMIPAEQFTEMVRSVINDYTRKKEGYQNRESITDFERTIQTELQAATKTEVQKLLSTPEWQGVWNGSSQDASEKVKEALAVHGPDILNRWLSSAIQQTVQQMQYNR